MTQQQPSLSGYAGQPEFYTLPGGTTVNAGEVTQRAFEEFGDDISREGMTADSNLAAWNNLSDTARMAWIEDIAWPAMIDEANIEAETAIPDNAVIRSAAQQLGDRLIACTIDELKMMERPWAQMKQAQQQEVLDRVAANAVGATRDAARLIATQERPYITGDLEQITVKDSAKATIIVNRRQITEHALEAVGNQVIILLVASLPVSVTTPKASADQGQLPLGDQSGVVHSDPED